MHSKICSFFKNIKIQTEIKKRNKDIKNSQLRAQSVVSEWNVGAVPNYVYLLIFSPVEMKTRHPHQWIHVSTTIDPKMRNWILVDGSFIEYIISILVLQDQTIHYDEEQIRNSH